MKPAIGTLAVLGVGGARCPACDGAGLQARIRYPSMHARWSQLFIDSCGYCGFGHVPHVDFDLAEYYREDYGTEHGRRSYVEPAVFFDALGTSRQRIVRRARAHARLISQFAGRPRVVLDVGAGVGVTLALTAAERKVALELDSVSVPYLDYQGIEIIDDLAAFTGRADVIIASHFLEHLPISGLAPFLAAVRCSLACNGILLAEVPEWGFVQHRTLPRRHGHEPHTLFFSPRAFARVMQRAGFVPIYFQTREFVYELTRSTVEFGQARQKGVADATHLLGMFRAA